MPASKCRRQSTCPRSRFTIPTRRNCLRPLVIIRSGTQHNVQSPKSQDQSPKAKDQSPKSPKPDLDPESTIGLLLMRPQVISRTTKHYDALIRAIEAEGLSVIPALSTLMDNREAVAKFFVVDDQSKIQSPKSKVNTKNQRLKTEGQRPKTSAEPTDNGQLTTDKSR